MRLVNLENPTVIVQDMTQELPEILEGSMIQQSDFYKGFVVLSDYFERGRQRQKIEAVLADNSIPYEPIEYITFNREAYRIFVPLEELEIARQLSAAIEFSKVLTPLLFAVLADKAYWFREFIAPTQVTGFAN